MLLVKLIKKRGWAGGGHKDMLCDVRNEKKIQQGSTNMESEEKGQEME